MVNPGYKESEVGAIPESWEVKILNELGNFSKGSGVKKAEANSGDLPCVRYGELYTHHNDVVRSFRSHISAEVAESSRAITRGDVLFACSGETKEEIGKCAVYLGEGRAYAGGDIVILSLKLGEPAFWGYLLNAPKVSEQKARTGQGDAVVHTNAGALGKIIVPYPPETEQKAIAEALTDVDGLIAGLEAMIAKKRDLRTATMQQLLTGKTRLPGFGEGVGMKQTAIGEYPADWKISRIADLFSDISMGPFGSDITVSNFVSEGVPVLSGDNIRTHKLEDGFKNYVTPEKAKSLKRAVAKRGDIVVTHRGTIGQIAFVPGDSEFEHYVISQSQFRATFADAVDPMWTALYFLSERGSAQLLEGKGHTGVPAIAQATTTFRKLLLPLPAREEQTAITEVFADLDLAVKAAAEQLSKAKAFKQGMMQELLTGRTRLI
ncbi:MAG: restriction endonuclease subunit S [Pseudomonadota bacterium]